MVRETVNIDRDLIDKLIQVRKGEDSAANLVVLNALADEVLNFVSAKNDLGVTVSSNLVASVDYASFEVAKHYGVVSVVEEEILIDAHAERPSFEDEDEFSSEELNSVYDKADELGCNNIFLS